MSPSTRVEKLMSARGAGGIFCQKLTEAHKGGGGVKIDQILADVICEPSLTNCGFVTLHYLKSDNYRSDISMFVLTGLEPLYGSRTVMHRLNG